MSQTLNNYIVVAAIFIHLDQIIVKRKRNLTVFMYLNLTN